MEFKILTDRLNSYEKNQIIKVDPTKYSHREYKALYTLVENGEAKIIGGSKSVKKTVKKVIKKAVKKVAKKTTKKTKK